MRLILNITNITNIEEFAMFFKEFAISKSALEKSLRTLNSMSNRIVVAELNMGLDSITLRQDITPIDALRIATQ